MTHGVRQERVGERRAGKHSPASRLVVSALATLVLFGGQALTTVSATQPAPVTVAPNAVGLLDCNGYSSAQRTIKPNMICADPHGAPKAGGGYGKFYDNGWYVGHDEPSTRFISNAPATGNTVSWNDTLPVDPAALPTVHIPGNDVTHTFELTAAPWFSMAICDSKSYPQTHCTPNSNSNAPSSTSPGGGSALLELQLYPPGSAPFIDNISCNNKYYCAALTIDSLEYTNNFASFNSKCVEPVNFAFIQRNGVPAGPPSPQLANQASMTPNRNTLMMRPGDHITAQVFDAPIGGGQHALETRIIDWSTGQTGYMVASAANGFMNTSIANCSGTPHNFQPEYNSAAAGNIVPWAALQANINSTFEIGHFTPCTSVSGLATYPSTPPDPYYQHCSGPYENTTLSDTSSLSPEPADSPCFTAGDTHNGLAAGSPNLVTGCLNFYAANGDLDFDGTSYWKDWPTSLTPNRFPSTVQQSPPSSFGRPYPQLQFQADIGGSEATCQPSGLGCTVPPLQAPGGFYPYWTQAAVHRGGFFGGRSCVWEFGNMHNGVTFGRDRQYGTPSARYYGDLASPIIANPVCS